MIRSNITVDPETLIFTSSGDSKEITLSNLDIPDEEEERRLIIVASGTNCTDKGFDCNNTFKHQIKRNILITVVSTKLSWENNKPSQYK